MRRILFAWCGWIALASAAFGQEAPSEIPAHKAGEKHTWANPKGVETPPSMRYEQRWQAKGHCGVNALQALLLMHNIKVPRDELGTLASPGEAGASLEELRVLAARYGLQTTVVRSSPDKLSSLPMPLIMHQSLSEKGKSDRDHFILVVGRDGAGRYAVIDGTSGSTYNAEPESLEPLWSCYALIVPTATPFRAAILAARILTGFLLAGVVACQVYAFARRPSARPSTVIGLGTVGG